MKLSKKTAKNIGWIGTIIYLGAYTLNSLGFVDSTGIIYGLSNLVAGFLLGVRVYYDKNWSNLMLEIFFIIVAVINIVRYFWF